MSKYIIAILAMALFLFGAVQAWKVKDLEKEITELQYDYAEIHQINYGLFNIQLWKDKALSIASKRISAFKISPVAYDQLEAQVEVFVTKLFEQYIKSGQLIDEIASAMEKDTKIPKMFLTNLTKTIKKEAQKIDIKPFIPRITKEITQEVRKSEPQLRKIMQNELMGLLMEKEESTYKDRRDRIYKKYAVADASEASTLLIEQMLVKDVDLKDRLKKSLWGIGGAILLVLLSWKWLGVQLGASILTIVSILLLILGVQLPMMNIDARLNAFKINILDSLVEFGEQTIYFQSKSILDVTQTLWQAHAWDLRTVGVLIFLFSIVMPFTKLISTFVYLFVHKWQSSKVLQTIIFYFGKWSMADVFVVAIFMAFIGMYGILTAQLGAIATNQNGFAVETVNYSKLNSGAYYFTSYCIISIITSMLIQRHAKKETLAF